MVVLAEVVPRKTVSEVVTSLASRSALAEVAPLRSLRRAVVLESRGP